MIKTLTFDDLINCMYWLYIQLIIRPHISSYQVSKHSAGFRKLRKQTISVVMYDCLSIHPSVCLPVYLSGTPRLPPSRIFIKFHICGTFFSSFENLPRKLNFHYNLARITGTLYDGPCTYMKIYDDISLGSC